MAVLKNLCANGECCQLALDSVQRWSSSTTAFAAAVVLRPNNVHASTLMLCLLYISIIQIKSFHLDLSPHFQRGPVTRNLSSYIGWHKSGGEWEPAQCPVPRSSESTPSPSPASPSCGPRSSRSRTSPTSRRQFRSSVSWGTSRRERRHLPYTPRGGCRSPIH